MKKKENVLGLILVALIVLSYSIYYILYSVKLYKSLKSDMTSEKNYIENAVHYSFTLDDEVFVVSLPRINIDSDDIKTLNSVILDSTIPKTYKGLNVFYNYTIKDNVLILDIYSDDKPYYIGKESDKETIESEYYYDIEQNRLLGIFDIMERFKSKIYNNDGIQQSDDLVLDCGKLNKEDMSIVIDEECKQDWLKEDYNY